MIEKPNTKKFLKSSPLAFTSTITRSFPGDYPEPNWEFQLEVTREKGRFLAAYGVAAVENANVYRESESAPKGDYIYGRAAEGKVEPYEQPSTDKGIVDVGEENKIESENQTLDDRLYWIAVRAAEEKMSEWIKYPKLRRKWVAVRDGEPVLPSRNYHELRVAYRAKYNEEPRYMIKVGTAKERTIAPPIL